MMMVYGIAGLPAIVTRRFSRTWKHRPQTRRAARERAWLKKTAHKAARRDWDGNFRRATEYDVV